jgi:putative transcriptional regulator
VLYFEIFICYTEKVKVALHYAIGRIKIENKIKQLREHNNLTQQDLAEKVSVSRQTIISLESGRYNPSIFLAFKIAGVFNLTIEDVFIFKEQNGK